MRKYIGGIISGIIIIVVGSYITYSPFRIEVNGLTVGMFQKIYGPLRESKSKIAGVVATYIKEFATYKSDWHIENIRTVQTEGRYDYIVTAENRATDSTVRVATPDLRTLPKAIYYTIIWGDPDTSRRIPDKPEAKAGPATYKIEFP